MTIRKKQLDDFISGWNLSQQCDFIFCGNRTANRDGQLYPEIVMSPDTLSVKDGDTVYCKTDMLPMLRRHLHRDKVSIHLVTHDSDFPIDKNTFSAMDDYCDIISWRGINIEHQNKKLSSIPIGLANDYCPITLKKKDILSAEDRDPEKLLYINFNTQTNSQEREPIYHRFKNSDRITVRNPREIESKQQYLTEITNHKFVMCPRGNGIDTHRMWECLYLGIIPVVKDCINIRFFSDLPILIVDDFLDLVGKEDYLEEVYADFSNRNWNLDKLTVEHWI